MVTATAGQMPTRPQIERQLARMLQSQIFIARHGQANLLKGIVAIAFDEGEVREQRIHEVVFTNKHELGIVRVQVQNLRKSIEEYYSGIGQNDLIFILLRGWLRPDHLRGESGQNYMPVFLYNLQHTLVRQYVVAWTKLNSGSLPAIEEATRILALILKEDTEYAEAWSALGDAYCWNAMLVLHSKPDEHREALEMADQCAAIAEDLAPNLWHAHATRAFHLMLSSRPKEAASAFSKARDLNWLMLENYGAYLVFIINTGDEEALELLKNRAVESMGNPGAPIALSMYGHMLGLAGYPDKAEAHYREALNIDPNNGMCHLGLCLLLAKQDRLDEAEVHAHRAVVLLGSENVTLWLGYMSRQNAKTSGNDQT